MENLKLCFLLSENAIELSFDVIDLVVVNFEGFTLEISQILHLFGFEQSKPCPFRTGRADEPE